MSSVGQRIKLVRQELKLSQQQFGEIFNAGKSYISAVENDKSKLSVENLVKLLVNYDVNINYILAERGTMFVASEDEDIQTEEVLKEIDRILIKYGVKKQ
jgi:transcriptional regulator with XRE-family HTH domain